MAQMYKIFINDKPFIITQRDVEERRFAACQRIRCNDTPTLMEQVRKTEEMQSKGIVLICEDAGKTFGELKTKFITIEAAGGVVLNSEKQLLLIRRLGKWDLPKGKMDPGETAAAAAVREVNEECGIGKLEIMRGLDPTYHTYKIQGHRFLKVTHWFMMRSHDAAPLVPQAEESITEAVWTDPQKLEIDNLDTYLSIKELLYAVEASQYA
jgi:8-oxo-dGTP pyrophosphatase MutT (NUDIX family)